MSEENIIDEMGFNEKEVQGLLFYFREQIKTLDEHMFLLDDLEKRVKRGEAIDSEFVRVRCFSERTALKFFKKLEGILERTEDRMMIAHQASW